MRTTGARLIALMLLVLLATGVALADLKREEQEFNGKKRSIVFYVPKSAAHSQQPAPLLILLHGSGRNGQIMIDQWKKHADEQGIMLAAPDAINPMTWNLPDDGPYFLRGVVALAKTKAAIDPRRVYVFGHSAGAVFALIVGFAESEYFAAVAVHAGSLRGNDGHFIAYAKRKIPVQIAVGTADQFFPLTEVRATRDALTTAGFPLEFIEMPKHDHNYYQVSKEVNQKAWEFLREKALPSDPVFAQYNF